jgi:hypothetical protein
MQPISSRSWCVPGAREPHARLGVARRGDLSKIYEAAGHGSSHQLFDHPFLGLQSQEQKLRALEAPGAWGKKHRNLAWSGVGLQMSIRNNLETATHLPKVLVGERHCKKS